MAVRLVVATTVVAAVLFLTSFQVSPALTYDSPVVIAGVLRPAYYKLCVSVNGHAFAPLSWNSIVSVTWDWGDGTVIQGDYPQAHNYASPGNYNLTVTARDSGGNTGVTREVLAVTGKAEDAPPVSPFYGGVDLWLNLTAIARYDTTTTVSECGPGQTSYRIDWGDGSQMLKKPIGPYPGGGSYYFNGTIFATYLYQHQYSKPGNYNVCATWEDSFALNTTVCRTRLVQPPTSHTSIVCDSKVILPSASVYCGVRVTGNLAMQPCHHEYSPRPPSCVFAWSQSGSGRITISVSDPRLWWVQITGRTTGTVVLRANFSGDSRYPWSIGNITIIVSSVQISCTKTTLAVGSSNVCKATVNGTSPKGTIKWSSGGAGKFSRSSCSLSRGGCAVGFTPTSANSTTTVTAAYGGSGENPPSEGVYTLNVTRKVTITSVSCKSLTVITGRATSCTATARGYKPTGTFSWSQTGGSGLVYFSSGTCKVVLGRCSVTLKGQGTGLAMIQVAYSGDSNNMASLSGSLSLKVK